MSDPPGQHGPPQPNSFAPGAATMQEQLAHLRQQQQQAQEQQRRLEDELRRLESQARSGGGQPQSSNPGSGDPQLMQPHQQQQQQQAQLSMNNHGASQLGLAQQHQQQQQQHQQQQQGGFPTGTASARSNSSNNNHLNNFFQNFTSHEPVGQAEGRASAPNAGRNQPSTAGGGNPQLESMLLSMLSQQQQQQQQQQQIANMDNVNLLRTLQQLGVRLPTPQAPPQDPLSAMLTAHGYSGLSTSSHDLGTMRALSAAGLPGQPQLFGEGGGNSSLLNNSNAMGGVVGATTAAINPTLTASASSSAPQGNKAAAAASAPGSKKKSKKAAKKSNEEDKADEEVYPIPELPKVRPLPPLEEGDTRHFSERVIVPLATEEDCNWLSERQCFIRAELLEVVRASHQDVLVRSSSKSVAYQQVGIRCRYCAHLHPSARAIRSSAFPSSIRQMYQSFTMMVRDHWAGCTAMPPNLKKRFLAYQDHKIPSSSLSREYWAYAAEKIGMINTAYGITITKESLDKAEALPSFGTTPEHIKAMQEENREKKSLIHPSDQQAISPYLFLLMNQVEECYLLESERVGKRKDAPVGLTGFGCQHCIEQGRLGFCRVFPLNKRSLPTKVHDLYSHLMRCPLTPPDVRAKLRELKKESSTLGSKFNERDREFVDQLWTKLGRKGAQIGSS